MSNKLKRIAKKLPPPLTEEEQREFIKKCFPLIYNGDVDILNQEKLPKKDDINAIN